MSADFPRLSRTERRILELLVGAPHMYGLEIVRESEGQIKQGSVYVTLNRMEDKGYVESWTEASSRHKNALPRRLYRASGLGARVLRALELVSLLTLRKA
jgi:DNA-binding PadR family transcriptional regulator